MSTKVRQRVCAGARSEVPSELIFLRAEVLKFALRFGGLFDGRPTFHGFGSR